MSKFLIEFTFQIEDRGFVLGGDILDGTVRRGMYARLPICSGKTQPVAIKAIETGHRGTDRQDFVGLVLEDRDQSELDWLRTLELTDIIIEVADTPFDDADDLKQGY